MIATQKQKRVVGALVLLCVFCIAAPFLVTGRNVNAGSTAVSKMTDRKSHALPDYDALENDKPMPSAHDDPVIADSSVEEKLAASAPIIVEDAPKQQTKDLPAKPIADSKISETKVAQSDAGKGRETPKKETKEQQKPLQPKTPAKEEQQPKTAQSKHEPPKPAAKESPKKPQTITVIDTKNDQRQEIKVVSREEAAKAAAAKAAAEKDKNSGKVAIPVSRPGERYSVRVGVFSSITAAKNVQTKIGSACPGAMVKPVSVNEKRMFKVTCGMSTDMSKVHAAQLKVSTMLGQQVTIEKN